MALVLTVPIRDYALPEFKEWQWHPSASTLAHFQEKQQEEVGLRRTAAASFAIAAVLLAIRLFSRRQNQKDSI